MFCASLWPFLARHGSGHRYRRRPTPLPHHKSIRHRSRTQHRSGHAPACFETILASYWKPVYKYVRLKWQANNEDAKDLTQGFFANVFEKNHFANYDAGKASFQTFVRTCLDGFIANERKAGKRLKRGGDRDHFQLDFIAAEQEFALHAAASDLNPEDYFHREWVRWMFSMAVETLRRRCGEAGRTVHFQLFESYDLSDNEANHSYASLGRQFGLEPATVNNYLAATRRDFRLPSEQARGEVDRLDERSDVYSLGAVLYFLLTDRSPESVSPRALNPKVSKAAEAICLKAMSPASASRYESAAELSRDIGRLLDEEPVAAYRESAVERVGRWVSKNRFLVLLVLAYLLMRIFFIFTSRR